MNDAKKNFLAGLFGVAAHEVESVVGKLRDALSHDSSGDSTALEARVATLEAEVSELRKTLDDLTSPETAVDAGAQS